MDLSEEGILQEIEYWAPDILGRCPGACRPKIDAPYVDFGDDWYFGTERSVYRGGTLLYEPFMTLRHKDVANAWKVVGRSMLEGAFVLRVTQVNEGRDASGPIYLWEGVTVRSSRLTQAKGYVARCGPTAITGSNVKALIAQTATYRLMAGKVDWDATSIQTQFSRFPVALVHSVRLRQVRGTGLVIELHGLLETEVKWAGHRGPGELRPARMRVQRASDGRWVEVGRDCTIEHYEARVRERKERLPRPPRQRRILAADLNALAP